MKMIMMMMMMMMMMMIIMMMMIMIVIKTVLAMSDTFPLMDSPLQFSPQTTPPSEVALLLYCTYNVNEITEYLF